MPDAFEPSEFAREFLRFMQAMSALAPPERQPIRDLVVAHLGRDPSGLPSVTETLNPSEHPNLQLALETMSSEAGDWQVVGLPGELRHYGGFSLVGLVAGRIHGPGAEPSPVEFANVEIDAGRTLPCVQMGLYLASHEGARVVAMVTSGIDYGPRSGLAVEVLAADTATSTDFLARARQLMHEHNVYRGKVLSFGFTEHGHFRLRFHRLPELSRGDVILPEPDLTAIERHTVGIAEHADALLAAGRHLKRGLLLYGPPGTGKTLSVMYLCNRMPGRTTLLLTGQGVNALGQAIAVARSLQPSMVVLEDVDLVAMERTLPGMEENPLLFQLLDHMDGLADDADVVFVLTTNRVELLEPALAARPGRIDQAVEIKLPDAESRRRLFDLYLVGVSHSIENVEPFVEQTDGVSAAFIKELVRRAALVAVIGREGKGGIVVTAAHLEQALVDLLTHSATVTRAILGGGRP